ncbi:exonuclease domain-containing protein [Methylocystis parvus]|uniref:3'-5' exonuclease n=1 Tax=Methylocystis parvus TaxID=134 RepID=UPI003C75A54B
MFRWLSRLFRSVSRPSEGSLPSTQATNGGLTDLFKKNEYRPSLDAGGDDGLVTLFRQCASSHVHDWLSNIPERIAFVDVETTGLSSSDRVVSIGLIHLQTRSLQENLLDASIQHLIFDPEKKSAPKAEEVHGYDDWILRHQDRFVEHADKLRSLIDSSDLLVAHNVMFDLQFINREFSRCGMPDVATPTYCTMQRYRGLGVGGSSSLDNVCRKLGLSRLGNTHGALEDAWLVMQVYLWLHDCSYYASLPFSVCPDASVMNFKEPPARPEGAIPRRRKRAMQIAEAHQTNSGRN